jgi:hypothetical protein
MEAEDEPAERKRFRIFWCDIDGNPYECEAECDTADEVRSHRYRLDRLYKIRLGRRLYTREEFEELAKGSTL